MAVILALLLSPAVITPAPAPAHSCGLPARFDVGTPGSLTIGAAAEAHPVNKVEIHVPDGFRVDRVLPTVGWTGTQGDKLVTFTRGPIEAFHCAYFTVVGQALKRAVLVFPITTYGTDGTVTQYDDRDPSSLYPAQLVLAGVEPDSLIPGQDKGRSWLAPAAGAAIGAAAAFAVLLLVRRRRKAA
jgi:hypothetical protein